ncbi:hypothetical protein EMCRGX_G000263 [Ephydatia muelleri]
MTEAGVRCGSSALFAEARKHNANDSKCAELGWVCIPLAVESYGCWGAEAQQSFSRLAARLAIQMGCSKSQATTIVYQRLSLSLAGSFNRTLISQEETDSRQPQGSVLRENSQGFICPMCMEKLKSAEALQVHWESAHGNDFGGSVGTVHVTPAKKQPRVTFMH